MNQFGSGGTFFDIMDPNIVKKGIEDVREQMRDLQREAHLIESDMEKRRQEAIFKT
jgi:hypothetical protein